MTVKLMNIYINFETPTLNRNYHKENGVEDEKNQLIKTPQRPQMLEIAWRHKTATATMCVCSRRGNTKDVTKTQIRILEVKMAMSEMQNMMGELMAD